MGFKDKFDGIRILTVGRLSGEKGQALTIPILARLRNEGYNVKWYCVGDGELRNRYEELIEEYDINEYYVLLESDINPYPYFKECDLYVQPSRFEGYCLTLAEARVFNKPIVSTNFSGAREQLIDNETGLIVKYDEEELYKAIKKMIDEEELRKKFIYNLKKQRVNNREGLEELYKLTF
ncbi:glycosyltransferase [Clostridium saudiense]|uniref:glycosyltransferase n=1 Tax=Clostridium saudiense TaxID=1414720 RepID=UPI003264A7A9